MSLVEEAPAPTSTPASNPESTDTGQSNQGQEIDHNAPQAPAEPWYYDEDKPGEGDRPEWLNSKYKTAAEQAKAYNEAQKKLGAFKGAPEEYDLTVEGMPDVSFHKDDPLIQNFLEEAKKNNVSQEYVSNLLKTYVDMQKASRPDPDKELELLGAHAKQDIQILAQWGDNNLTKEESQLFKNMMTTAASVRLFEKLRGISTKADTQPGNPNTPRESEEAVRRMIHDPRYDEDESFRDSVREKLKQFGS